MRSVHPASVYRQVQWQWTRLSATYHRLLLAQQTTQQDTSQAPQEPVRPPHPSATASLGSSKTERRSVPMPRLRVTCYTGYTGALGMV